ncbi:MAG TPA: ABC transporter ATP-binding protein [Caldilineae bacterium]|nr:ABC transporter ATP-binding protein [Caldilineae bacterium]
MTAATATTTKQWKKQEDKVTEEHAQVIHKPDDTTQVLKRLLTYMTADEAKGKFTVAMILRVLALFGLSILPGFTGKAIDVITVNGAESELQKWVFLALAAGALYLLLSLGADRLFADLATRASYKLQKHLFSHMQLLSLSFFDRHGRGELMSRLTNDSEVIALFYESVVIQIIRALVQIVLAFAVMLFIDWRLMIVASLIVPAMLIVMYISNRIAGPAFAKLQQDLSDLSGFQEESLSGMKVIISNRRQDWADEKHTHMAATVFDVGSKAFFTSLLQYPLTQSFTYMGIVTVLVVGGLMVMSDNIALGTVIAFSGYVGLLAKPVSTISNLMGTAFNGIAGGRRVFSIIDAEPEIVDDPDATDYEFKGGHIVLKDVDFSYIPGRKILRHNTFEVQPGESVGICGPTGAGKSTLINILTRYYDIDSGTILIDGQDLKKLTRDSLRTQIGVVLQEAFLFSDTVMNNLKYARKGATAEECIAAAKKANAHDFIMRLPQGYDTVLTERGASLSQGQRQMITIARAMVADPKLLILDEATSNVDTRTEKLIQEALGKLMEGKTSFSIAHRLATIRGSSWIMVMNGGVIVEMGPHDELMAKKGFYYALYMSQFKGKAPGGSEAASVDFVST